MKKLFTFFISLSFILGAQAQVVPISQARMVAQGQPVEISGIVINDGALGPIRYIQDATGGLPVYDPTVTNTWNLGDSVTVAGEMGAFNGLIQITNTTSNTVHGTGTLPTPQVVGAAGINASTEATLLRVDDITFNNGGGTFANGTLSFTDNNGAVSQIYLRSGHPLIGSTIPLAKVNLTGVASVFAGSYQLLPRGSGDVQIASNFYFVSSPVQSNLAKTSFDVSWTTSAAGSTNIRYGLTDAMTNEINQGGSTANHTVSLTGLTAGEIYYVQAYSVDTNNDTITSPTALFATVSNSSGQIDVIFNQLVDVSVATGAHAVHQTGGQIEARMIDLIDNAQTSLDVCIYSIGRTTIITALNNAHNRGVQVRFITNQGSNNPALANVTPLFPNIKGNANALMHNKFIIADADSQDSCWLMMGSMNFNDDEMGSNYNSVLFIQDQSLAKAYRLEFQEMWGSTGATAGIFNVKFGAAKTNNTPHQFIIGGIPVESYFSPSDGTTNKIIEVLESADDDLAFALFSFTRNDIRDAIIAEHNAGTSVRGMIENINDTGGEYTTLLNQGVPMKAHPEPFLLHHKYGFVDNTNTSSDPTVITGSHNWSSAAENSNDENTLIIHDATITNMYAQEFNARWLGWTTNTTVVANVKGFETTIFPNPARDFAEISIENSGFENVVLSVYSMNGELVKTIDMNVPKGVSQHRLDVTDLPTGQYALLFNLGEFGKSELLQVVR